MNWWYVILYFVVAIIANMTTSAIVLTKVRNICKEAGKNFNEVYNRYFAENRNAIIPFNLPIIVRFFVTQIFWPYNVWFLMDAYDRVKEDFGSRRKQMS